MRSGFKRGLAAATGLVATLLLLGLGVEPALAGGLLPHPLVAPSPLPSALPTLPPAISGGLGGIPLPGQAPSLSPPATGGLGSAPSGVPAGAWPSGGGGVPGGLLSSGLPSQVLPGDSAAGSGPAAASGDAARQYPPAGPQASPVSQAHQRAMRQQYVRSRQWAGAVGQATQQIQGLPSQYSAEAARAGGGSGRFSWPEAYTVITQGFGCTTLLGEPYDPRCPSKHIHTGLDIAGPDRTPIFAADTGVASVYMDSSGYGRHVILVDGHGYETLYGHMSRIVVSAGQLVKRGDLIGFEGATGFATGPHLHFEIRWQGQPVDPCAFFHGCLGMDRQYLSWQGS